MISFIVTYLLSGFRLGLLNPVTIENEKYLSSQRASVELIRDMTGGGVFYNADHLLVLREERRDGQKNLIDANEVTLKGLVGDLIGNDWRLILRAKDTGACLNVCFTTETGTVLSAIEFRYFLCAHYNVTPSNSRATATGVILSLG